MSDLGLRATPIPLSLPTRAAMRMRRGGQLAREVGRYAYEQQLWWLVPFVAVLAIVALTLTTAHAALPYVVYTLV